MMHPVPEHADDERVVAVDFGVKWNPGAPELTVVYSDWRCFTGFRLRADTPPHGDVIGIIEWLRCRAVTVGPPNDEAISGHRLWGRGLSDVVWGGEVLASSWIAQLERQNRVHDRHDPGRFSDLRHFILLFKESVFECVAEDYVLDTVNASLTDVRMELAARLGAPDRP